ncbi:MAG: hypothetical protein LBE13_10715 [Bacteroidales bacterium]|jgi:hypothetical protein|nr:hypothetical protein [Bacteroidales bacterium]
MDEISAFSKKNDEIIAINNKLYNEFSIQELEERLEMDPFFISSLFNAGINMISCSCNNIQDCTDLPCGCNSGWSNTCACDDIVSCPNLGCGCNFEYS